MLGLATAETKLLGPVQLNVAPPSPLALRFNVCPAHIGLLLPAVGAAGVPVTTTFVVDGYEGHEFAVAITIHLYAPVAAVVTLVIVGF